jgi:hypothetical protein
MEKFEKIRQEVIRKTKQTGGNSLPETKTYYVSFIALKDGLAEMVYDPIENTTNFAIYQNGKISYKQFISNSETKFVPYSPNNNLIKSKVVLFPSKAEEYGSETELLKEIHEFIYRYADLSPFFHKLAPYYVLFSWVYDRFNEVPYLRFIGDTGSGKTRVVQTIGSLCYKPIFATGGASVSPIFRILDLFRGTLLLDEADYRFSDEKAEIIKLLNCGNTPTFPVLRSESKKQKEYDPVAFQVFGPKIFDTRGYFQDPALENRCLTEEMGQKKLREDIPINLPNQFWQEALGIRNKLLMFRFRNYGQKKINPELIDKNLEPRMNQIIIPLASIIADEETRKQLKDFSREYNNQLISDRGMREEAEVLEEIIKLAKEGEPSMQEIAEAMNERCGYNDLHYRGKKYTARGIGEIVRKKLKLLPKRKGGRGTWIIPFTEAEKIARLMEKFGIKKELEEKTEADLQKEAEQLILENPNL